MSANIEYSRSNTFDMLDSLPADDNMPSHNELQLVDTLFPQKEGRMSRLTNELKDIVILIVLFLVFSLPIVGDLIKKFVASSNNSIYILLLIKAFLFAITYYLLKNFYLTRK